MACISLKSCAIETLNSNVIPKIASYSINGFKMSIVLNQNYASFDYTYNNNLLIEFGGFSCDNVIYDLPNIECSLQLDD